MSKSMGGSSEVRGSRMVSQNVFVFKTVFMYMHTNAYVRVSFILTQESGHPIHISA